MADPIDLAEIRARREAARSAREDAAQGNPFGPIALLANLIVALEAEHAYAKSIEDKIGVLARYVAPDKAAFEDILRRLGRLESLRPR